VEGDIFSKYDLQLGSHNAVIGILHFGFKVFFVNEQLDNLLISPISPFVFHGGYTGLE